MVILLKTAREKAKLSQKQLAELSKVPQQTISAIESGTRGNPGADTLYRLANALGMTMDELYVEEMACGSAANADDTADLLSDDPDPSPTEEAV